MANIRLGAGPMIRENHQSEEDGSRHYRSPKERRSRTLSHFAVALAVQCGDSLKDVQDLFAKDKTDFPASDLYAIVREWQIDLSGTDVDNLVVELSRSGSRVSDTPVTETRISRGSWNAALAGMDLKRESLIRILTVVASAMLWDVRKCAASR